MVTRGGPRQAKAVERFLRLRAGDATPGAVARLRFPGSGTPMERFRAAILSHTRVHPAQAIVPC
jgi:hypothetical protein